MNGKSTTSWAIVLRSPMLVLTLMLNCLINVQDTILRRYPNGEFLIRSFFCLDEVLSMTR